MEQDKTELDSSVDHLEGYVQSQIELFKLRAFKKTAVFGGSFLSSLSIFFVLMIVILFVSIAIALLVGKFIGHPYLGFAIVAGFYLILFVFLSIRRTNFLRRILVDFMIRKLFEKFD